MYHRIAQPALDPWELSVSAANFNEQLQVLQRKYKVASVNSLITQIKNGALTDKTVCITFDDGYSDNYFTAKPILEKNYCPANFFIATHFLDQEQEYWWDELEKIVLHTKSLPSTLKIVINKNWFEFHLNDDALLNKEKWQLQQKWIWTEAPATSRCALYIALWERIRPLPFNEIQIVMEDLRAWAGSEVPRTPADFPMKSDQLQEMAANPLFDIGIHTATHPALGFHSKEMQQGEINAGSNYLQKKLGKIPRTMAYPYGHYNEDTLAIVQDIKISAAFTTEEKLVVKQSNPCQLGRFQVKNWNGKAFENQLDLWFKSI